MGKEVKFICDRCGKEDLKFAVEVKHVWRVDYAGFKSEVGLCIFCGSKPFLDVMKSFLDLKKEGRL